MIVAKVLDAHKTYKLGHQDVPALRGVTVDIRQGEFVALAGPSGSGKTTLLNLLGCLDTVSKGTVEVLGVRTEHASDEDTAGLRAEKIGFIFQNFNLIPVLSALENVEYPLLKRKMSSRELRNQALEVLALVGLKERVHHRPDELSGGQRQRVAIARAIIHKPALIIADEPTAALDKKTATDILDLLNNIRAQLGITIVMASHDPLAISKASRIVQVSDGLITSGAS